MSELKRVPFETIGAKKPSNSPETEQGPETIVLELELFEPTNDSFPQYDYEELINIEKVWENVRLIRSSMLLSYFVAASLCASCDDGCNGRETNVENKIKNEQRIMEMNG